MMLASVPVMHEYVHEWAGREEEPRQPGQHVSPMLGNQEKSANQGKGEEHELHPWAQSALVVPTSFRHGRLLAHDVHMLKA
jgi:hypothetical protein